MQTPKKFLQVIALATVCTLGFSACAADENSKKSRAATAEFITANGSEPERALIPSDTNEVGGGKILEALFAGLIYYDAAGVTHYDVAKSIEPNADASEFTIKLRDDAKFSDGTAVTAASFVRAWNQGASNELQHVNSYFFQDIQGFEISDGPDGVSGTDDDVYGAIGDMSGLVIDSEYQFTVKLKAPAADFPQRLGYAVFYPLPESAFADLQAFGQHPIGNGSYKFASADAWQHNVEISLVKNDSYNGPRQAQNPGIKIIFYASPDAAYADLQSGNLDVLDAIADTALASYQKDLGERAINQPAAVSDFITIPERVAHFGGEEGKLRRAAISLAFDRAEITRIIFYDTRTPASDFTSPVISGWSDGLRGAHNLRYNPALAKQLWEKADAISPWQGTFEIAYNADGGHQSWVDAIVNSVKNTLGIAAAGHPYPTFAEFRTQISNDTIDTAFRDAWQGDYPGMFNFLGPLYGSGAGSNDSDYANPEFDQLLSEGSQMSKTQEATAKFQQAQELLLEDLPALPLWYRNLSGGYSEHVQDVEFAWNSVPLFYQMKKK